MQLYAGLGGNVCQNCQRPARHVPVVACGHVVSNNMNACAIAVVHANVVHIQAASAVYELASGAIVQLHASRLYFAACKAHAAQSAAGIHLHNAYQINALQVNHIAGGMYVRELQAT